MSTAIITMDISSTYTTYIEAYIFGNLIFPPEPTYVPDSPVLWVRYDAFNNKYKEAYNALLLQALDAMLY